MTNRNKGTYRQMADVWRQIRLARLALRIWLKNDSVFPRRGRQDACGTEDEMI